MPIKSLFDKYKVEFCSKCKNKCKEFTLCNVTIHEGKNTKEARCSYYEEKK